MAFWVSNGRVIPAPPSNTTMCYPAAWTDMALGVDSARIACDDPTMFGELPSWKMRVLFPPTPAPLVLLEAAIVAEPTLAERFDAWLNTDSLDTFEEFLGWSTP